MGLTFDYSLTGQPEALQLVAEQQKEVYSRLQSQKKEAGFARLPYQAEEGLQKLANLVSNLASTVKAVLVLGVGGSDLGAKAVHQALHHHYYNQFSTPQLFFLGDSTDPQQVRETLEVVDLAQTLVVVVSKSGTTIEQMSVFLYLRQELRRLLGPDQARHHIVVVTDPEKGALRELVNKEGYASLDIPPEVGGRFSVLSNAGLFPLALTGVNVTELLAGARSMDEADSAQASTQNPAFLYALWQTGNYPSRPLSVLMPYQKRLEHFALWYRQLWAESLGKKNRDGQSVGITPIASIGPVDQHSQLQLYLEGPDDKQFTFLTVEEIEQDLSVPEVQLGSEAIDYLSNHSFAEILKTEYRSTAVSLHRAGRPSCTLTLQKLDAFHLGMVLYFFQLSVVYIAELWQINAYDQPGVEASKQYLYTSLGRPGYDHVVTVPQAESHILTI